MLSPGPLKARRIIRVHARHRRRWREIGLGRVDPLQRPVKGTVYNASLVNYDIEMETTNGNMPGRGRATDRVGRPSRSCVPLP